MSKLVNGITMERKPETVWTFDNTAMAITSTCPNCGIQIHINRDTDPIYPEYHFYKMFCRCKLVHWVDWKAGELHMGLDVGRTRYSDPKAASSVKTKEDKE